MSELEGLLVRVPTEADIPAMVSVLQRAFGSWPRHPDPAIPPEEHLRWKLNNHEIARRIHTVAELGDRMISVRLRLMQPALIEGRPILLRQAVDDAVDPDYQRRGVNREMTRYFNDHLRTGDVAMNFSTSVVAHRRGQEGFTTLGRELVVLYRALGLRALSGFGRAGGGEDFGHQVRARALLRALAIIAGPHRSGSVEIRGIERFTESADRLFEEVRGGFDWILLRSSSYLNWRFGHPSAGRYAIRGAFEGDDLTGYCVLRIGGPCAHVADLLALPGRGEVVDALVLDALEVAAASGAAAAVCWLPCDHPYLELVRRRGFVGTGSNPGCMVRNEKLEPGALAFLERPEARVHLTAGDSDWV